MAMKINNTYIVEKMEDIPIKDMRPGRQVMLIEQVQDKESQAMVDRTTNMCLERITMGRIYSFAAAFDTPIIQLDNEKYDNLINDMGEEAADELTEEEQALLATELCIEDVFYETDNQQISMMEINGKLIHLQVNSEYKYDRKKHGYRREDNAKKSQKCSKLYSRIFDWSINYDALNGSYRDQHVFTQYFSVPLENRELAMAFVIEHDIRPEYRYWNTNRHIYLINREGDVVKIESPFEYIYDIIKATRLSKRFEEAFNKFEEVLFAEKYDIRHFIKDKGKGLYRVKKVFIEEHEIYKHLDMFYSPFFVDGDVTVYPDSVRGYNRSPKLMVNGEEVGWNAEKKYPDHYRVGEALLEFTRQYGTGVNPATGEIINNDNLKLIYGDDEGLIISSTGGYDKNLEILWIKKLGHFVRGKHEEDEQDIKELRERYKLVKLMSDAPQINRAV